MAAAARAAASVQDSNVVRHPAASTAEPAAEPVNLWSAADDLNNAIYCHNSLVHGLASALQGIAADTESYPTDRQRQGLADWACHLAEEGDRLEEMIEKLQNDIRDAREQARRVA